MQKIKAIPIISWRGKATGYYSLDGDEDLLLLPMSENSSNSDTIIITNENNNCRYKRVIIPNNCFSFKRI